MSDLTISNIRELDMNEIQQVSGGYIPIGPTFTGLSFALQGASMATKDSYPNLSNSLNWGSWVFSGFGLFGSGW